MLGSDGNTAWPRWIAYRSFSTGAFRPWTRSSNRCGPSGYGAKLGCHLTAPEQVRALYFGHASYARVGGSLSLTTRSGKERPMYAMSFPPGPLYAPLLLLALGAVGPRDSPNSSGCSVHCTPVELLAYLPRLFRRSCNLSELLRVGVLIMYISSLCRAPCRLHLTATLLRHLGL